MRKHYSQNGGTLPSRFQFNGVFVARSTRDSQGLTENHKKRHVSNCLAAVDVGLLIAKYTDTVDGNSACQVHRDRVDILGTEDEKRRGTENYHNNFLSS
jgi:hypothetical protein